jgi:hypothetical protein
MCERAGCTDEALLQHSIIAGSIIAGSIHIYIYIYICEYGETIACYTSALDKIATRNATALPSGSAVLDRNFPDCLSKAPFAQTFLTPAPHASLMVVIVPLRNTHIGIRERQHMQLKGRYSTTSYRHRYRPLKRLSCVRELAALLKRCCSTPSSLAPSSLAPSIYIYIHICEYGETIACYTSALDKIATRNATAKYTHRYKRAATYAIKRTLFYYNYYYGYNYYYNDYYN